MSPDIVWPITATNETVAESDFIAETMFELCTGLEIWDSEDAEANEIIRLTDARGRKLIGKMDLQVPIELRIDPTED